MKTLVAKGFSAKVFKISKNANISRNLLAKLEARRMFNHSKFTVKVVNLESSNSTFCYQSI